MMASQVTLRVQAVRCLCQAAQATDIAERERLLHLAWQLEREAQNAPLCDVNADWILTH